MPYNKEPFNMNHTPRFGFIVEYVTDIEAAKRFYVEALGLEVERQSPVYVQFNHFALASDESLSGSREPEVYWLVDDVEAAFNAISPKAEVIVPLKQMPFGKVFGIKDPAGQPLYLLEFAQNRPSQPVK
jgi:predicted enzyme related to lactoylglutathione lyase